MKTNESASQLYTIERRGKKAVTAFTAVLFIAVFGSSMLGAQLFGVSINKIALLPLEIYLFVQLFKTNQRLRIKPTAYGLVLLYIIQILSSLYALTNRSYASAYADYDSRLMNNVLQYIIFYLPILIGLGSLDRKDLILQLKRVLLWVVRIHCAWALIQFVLWYLMEFDFNGFVFTDLLNGALGPNYKSTLINLGNYNIQLRATGINYEPAMLALIMFLGICFEEKWILKFVYFAACITALSRVGIVVVAGILVFEVLYERYLLWEERRRALESGKMLKKEKGNALVLVVISTIGVVAVLFVFFRYYDLIMGQISNMIKRFADMGNSVDGSDRHIMYPVYCWYSWVMDLDVFQKFFGIGPRVSGLAFVESPYVSSVMTFVPTMLTSAWEIESDTAAILLGTGLFGFITYLLILWKMMKSGRKELTYFSIGLFVYGFMYNCFSNTLMQVVLLIAFVSMVGNGQKRAGKEI